ncbi:M13 family peptidase [Altererythrobacter confluentis]|uniref:M13 family peptidase n=1 Tax=Allopontixanthobacter confluentis TaxID=1849021 RepID=A0A6L7GIT0_9SPHN|nr:M13 family metallopeptidase [Allopontixanthobacter confluentis]MXP15416.1 M13 family peptidase [Allopontixanthobacter confluentis]
MIKTILAAGGSALALALATPALAQDTASETQATPTMSFGKWGVDPDALDKAVDPGDDFFKYVNGKWLDENPLPAEYSRFGAFNLLGEKSTVDVKAVVDDLIAANPAPGTSERRIVDAYQTFLDTDAIDAAGLAPVNPYLYEIYGANTLGKLADLWGKPGFAAPVGAFVTVDQKQPDTYVAYVGSGGLGLPDRQYYLDESEKGRDIQQKYRDYLTFLFKEAGFGDAALTAQVVYDFEDTIAREISWDRTVSRNRDLSYNAVTPAELKTMAGTFPLQTMLDTAGLGNAPKFVVPQIQPTAEEIAALGLTPEYVAMIGKGTPGMFDLISSTPVATLQAWTVARFLTGNSSAMPTRFDEANFDFFGKTLRGQPEQRPRWKRAISEVESHLGEVLGKSYVERNFPAENKAAMVDLVENLRIAMAQSIDELNWMGAETKVEAMAKLAAFDPKIGYRDNLETYDGLAIVAGNPIANRMAAAKWGWEYNIAQLGGPIDRTEWGMLPQTVNAYYNPTKNEIVFPAAILQQPFFGITADAAVNYGGIGGVIGHEMGHGFDDQGSKSDGTGLLRNWWQPDDLANFTKLTDALVTQYDAFCPLDDGKTCVNGRLTLGENIGDLGGLSLAYRAYKLSLDGKEDKVIDGLTGDQRFFLAWAQVWRSSQREDNARQRLRTDPHSPEEFRVNGIVRNMDAWYKAFNVTPDDALYLAPEKRLSIW